MQAALGLPVWNEQKRREKRTVAPYEHENSGKNRDNDPQLSTPRRSVKMGKSYGTRGGNSCVLLSHAD